MNKSENIGELVKALSKFQGEVADPTKDKTGYNYKYADLLSILETARPLLAQNGLCITQLVNTPGDKVSIETMLAHESGQWISSATEMNVPQFKNLTPPQCVGIVITYARRYALAAILGIAQADADASDQVVDRESRNSQNKAKSSIQNYLPSPQSRATSVQINELLSLVKEDQEKLSKILVWANINNIDEISQDHCLKAIESCKQKQTNGSAQ